jgi:ribonuclease HI
MSKLQIYTDGASNPHAKPTPGGWAYVYVHNGIMLCSGWGGEKPTTNQACELLGAVKGLQDIFNRNELECIQYDTIEVITDSAYMYRGMVEKWYVDWNFNNWQRKEKDGSFSPLANAEIWKALVQAQNAVLQKGLTLQWTKIRGHRGVLFNEVCDKLAVKGKLSVS